MSNSGLVDFYDFQANCQLKKRGCCSLYTAPLDCEYDICPHTNDSASFNATVKQNAEREKLNE